MNNSNINNSNLSGSYIRSSSPNDKMVKLNESKIYFHTEKSVDSNAVISAIKVKGFEGEDYNNKKIKKFNISIDVEEKDLIKESNYFD